MKADKGERAGAGAVAFKRVRVSNGLKRTVCEMVGGILLGMILPRAEVYEGLMPFGVGMVAAVNGPVSILVYLASIIGYLLQGSSSSLRYLAALVAVVGMRWAINGFHIVSKSVLFPACVTGISLMITGSALLLGNDPGIGAILTIAAESVLGAGFAYFVSCLLRELPYFGERALSERGKISAVVLLAVAMMALLTVEFSGISPGRVLCGLCILVSARCARLAGGASVGILMSIAILLTTPELAYLAPAFALGGVLSGLFSERGKWCLSLLYLSAIGIATVQAAQEIVVVIGLYEALASGLLFLAIPPSAELWIEHTFCSAQRLPEVTAARQSAAMKLQYAAKAMTEVVGTVDSVSSQLNKLGAPDIGSICTACTDAVCGKCKKRVECWEKHYSRITDALQHMLPVLRSQGDVQANAFTHRFPDCTHAEKICCALQEEYRAFVVRESAYRRLYELRGIVNDQFDSMATMLTEFSAQFDKPEWQDVHLKQQVETMLSKEGAIVEGVSCKIGEKGEMVIEMLLDGNYQPHDRDRFRRKIGHLCGRNFSLPMTEYTSGVTRICLNETARYHVTVGACQLSCNGETLCGDSYEVTADGNGGYCAVLSDGMGSGGRAAVDSAMTAGMAMRLWKAGFGHESILRMINTALVAKSQDESLATLDMVDINLYSGVVKLIKAGAGVSLLFSKGRVSQLREATLPLGILRDLSVSCETDTLTSGDILVLMSDGVTNEGVEWVTELIKEFGDDHTVQLEELAETIALQARERQGEEYDDTTVLVMQLVNDI